jgi:hypothetical protein
MSDDSLIERTESTAAEKGGGRSMQAANLFDLRRIIGGLFVAYGILMTILGLTDSDAEIAKAAGININLWAGLGMLVFGALFILWSLWRPLGEELREAEEGESSGPLLTSASRGDPGRLAGHQRGPGLRDPVAPAPLRRSRHRPCGRPGRPHP